MDYPHECRSFKGKSHVAIQERQDFAPVLISLLKSEFICGMKEEGVEEYDTILPIWKSCKLPPRVINLHLHEVLKGAAIVESKRSKVRVPRARVIYDKTAFFMINTCLSRREPQIQVYHCLVGMER